MVEDALDSHVVAEESEAADHAEAGGREIGVVAELFTLVDITDMYFHDGTFQAADTVLQGDTRMSVSTGVEDDTVVVKADLLHLVDKLAFDIALIVINLQIRIFPTQNGEIALERVLAVDARLPDAQEVEVRTIDNLYFLHLILFSVLQK